MIILLRLSKHEATRKNKRFLEEYELACDNNGSYGGACPPALAAAVNCAGGMGACGALMLNSGQIGLDKGI